MEILTIFFSKDNVEESNFFDGYACPDIANTIGDVRPVTSNKMNCISMQLERNTLCTCDTIRATCNILSCNNEGSFAGATIILSKDVLAPNTLKFIP